MATSEAHDSGLCAADTGTRRRFASDLLNLALAAPAVNRRQKGANDAGEWLLWMNRCWFAARVVAVKRKYRLTVDAREARALEGGLVAVRIDRDGGSRWAGGRTGAVVEGARRGRGRRAAALGHERERAHHLSRGACSRHRPGAARAPGIPLHARRRRGRRGVRVKARTECMAGHRERRRILMARGARRALKLQVRPDRVGSV